MGHSLTLIQAEFRKTYFTLRSYTVQLVADQVFLIFTFLLVTGILELVTSGNYSKDEQLASLTGFLVWRVAAGIMAEVTTSVANDAQWGTLEQLHLGNNHLWTILTARGITQLFYYSLRVLLVAIIMILLLDLPFHFIPGSLVIYALTFISPFGLTLALVGLHLVYKNISTLIGALATILLFLTGCMSPLQGVPILFEVSRFLPLSIGVDLFRQMVVDGQSLLEVVSSVEFLGLLVNSLVYLMGGVLVLNWARKKAFTNGSLAHY
ncbi:MAG: ABC transporter permease [Anaerolineae bacterium]|nr:ABC transporter permease [Anaerolineae bacterium]